MTGRISAADHVETSASSADRAFASQVRSAMFIRSYRSAQSAPQ